MPLAHPNTLLQFFHQEQALASAVFIVSFAFSHLVFESFASVLFSTPSELQAGMTGAMASGSHACKTLATTILESGFFCAALLPIAIILLPAAYGVVEQATGFVLLFVVAVSIFMLFARDKKAGPASLVVFLVSGFFGIIVFSSGLSHNPLFPLLASLFGFPALLDREEQSEKVDRDRKSLAVGCVLGLLSVLLPAVTPTLIVSVGLLFLESSPTVLFSLASGVAVSRLFFDIVGVSAFGKPRSGIAVAVQQQLGQVSLMHVVTLSAAALASIAIAVVACEKITAKIPSSSSHSSLKLGAFAIVSISVALLDGVGGLLVLLAGCCIALFAKSLNAPRSWNAGALILPSLMYFFGLHALVLGWLF